MNAQGAKPRFQLVITSDEGRGVLYLTGDQKWDYTKDPELFHRFEDRAEAEAVLRWHEDYRTLTIHNIARRPETK